MGGDPEGELATLHTTRHMCGRRIRFSVFYLVSQSVSHMGYDALLPPDSPLLPLLRQLLIEKAPPSLSVCLSLPPSSIPGYGTHSSNQHKSRLPPILLAHLLRQNCWRRYVVRSVPSSPQQESQNLGKERTSIDRNRMSTKFKTRAPSAFQRKWALRNVLSLTLLPLFSLFLSFLSKFRVR